jgi:hypothetical protein
METEPAESKKSQGEAGLLSSITESDKKLALVTFAATLAANVATVIFIGLSIAAFHFVKIWSALDNSASQHNRQHLPEWIKTLVVVAIFGGGSLYLIKRVRNSRLAINILLVVAAAGTVGISIVILGTLGGLASIK